MKISLDYVHLFMCIYVASDVLQCCDTVGSVTGKASGL